MVLNNTFAIGCHVMFYEINMLPEYVTSILLAATEVENRENIKIIFVWNTQTYLEDIDTDEISVAELTDRFNLECKRLEDAGFVVIKRYKTDESPFYNIAHHRRELNYSYSHNSDFIVWGETDSMFPAEYFYIMQMLPRFAASNNIHRYIMNFADRKNWDSSWDVITHPLFDGVIYEDNINWMMNNEASSKSYMTYERMCEINSNSDEYDLRILTEPKFDGSCLTISKELILSGVNIPLAVTHCGEDTAFGDMAKKVLGDVFRQFLIKNILRVHNRRHPKKRMYIKNENNPNGFVGKDKGDWWDILEKTSKHNSSIIFNSQEPFIPIETILSDIKNTRKL